MGKIRIARGICKSVAEANNGAGKIGPVTNGEVVGAEGKKAVDGPELLDGNPVADVGPGVIPDVENSTDFFLRWTVVHGSRSSDQGSGSMAPVQKISRSRDQRCRNQAWRPMGFDMPCRINAVDGNLRRPIELVNGWYKAHGCRYNF